MVPCKINQISISEESAYSSGHEVIHDDALHSRVNVAVWHAKRVTSSGTGTLILLKVLGTLGAVWKFAFLANHDKWNSKSKSHWGTNDKSACIQTSNEFNTFILKARDKDIYAFLSCVNGKQIFCL